MTSSNRPHRGDDQATLRWPDDFPVSRPAGGRSLRRFSRGELFEGLRAADRGARHLPVALPKPIRPPNSDEDCLAKNSKAPKEELRSRCRAPHVGAIHRDRCIGRSQTICPFPWSEKRRPETMTRSERNTIGPDPLARRRAIDEVGERRTSAHLRREQQLVVIKHVANIQLRGPGVTAE
jgi:hypothetical protein